jgi:hypothetical protein
MWTDPASKCVHRTPVLERTPTAPVSRSEAERQGEPEPVGRHVPSGSLVIRRMTDEERRRCRPRLARHNQIRVR